MAPGEFRVLATEPELFEMFYKKKPSAYDSFYLLFSYFSLSSLLNSNRFIVT